MDARAHTHTQSASHLISIGDNIGSAWRVHQQRTLAEEAAGIKFNIRSRPAGHDDVLAYDGATLNDVELGGLFSLLDDVVALQEFRHLCT